MIKNINFSNRNIGSDSVVESQDDLEEKSLALSGQVYKIPNGSNLPTVDNWTDKSGLIPFGYTGSDMLLPLLIEQSIYEAPAHKSCIKLKVASSIGTGYEFVNYDESDVEQRMEKIHFEDLVIKGGINKFLNEITRDYALHNRINIKVIKRSGMTVFERMNPSTIGYNKDKSMYYYSRNFSSGKIEREFKRYGGQAEGVYLMDFDGTEDKYSPYAVPEWMAILPYIKINSMIPKFHEANMENSVGINLVIRRPSLFSSASEKNKYKNSLSSNRGVSGTGNFVIFSGNGMENVAEVQQLSPNQNDKLFQELRSSSIDDICMGHNVNPILIGVKTPGSLGANNEFDTAYNIFYNIEVEPIREHIEYVMNSLLKTLGHTYKIKLNDNKAYFKSSDSGTQNFELKKV